MVNYETYRSFQINSPLNHDPEIIVRDDPQQPESSEIPGDPVQQRMMFILMVVLVLIILFALFVIPAWVKGATGESAVFSPAVNAIGLTNPEPTAVPTISGNISPIFSTQVKHWEPQIVAWAARYQLDPNIVATIMQIESCGDPNAVSRSGAQGLFQVMPFHFANGENMQDPDTNATRGLNFYVEQLRHTSGDIYLSFAGYNGGYAASNSSWEHWANETQRYYTWAQGIYDDATAGLATSSTLEQWLAAGGASLCQQASNRLGLTTP